MVYFAFPPVWLLLNFKSIGQPWRKILPDHVILLEDAVCVKHLENYNKRKQILCYVFEIKSVISQGQW